MREGATYRNAISGSFPAVTASTHATIGTGAFPRTHGITGHNVRRDGGPVKAWGRAGHVDPSFLLEPTLADRWTGWTEDAAWVGEIGYQVWHVGMLGRGGRPMGEAPVGVYWDEDGGGGWSPHHPELYRLPNTTPGLERLDELSAGWDPPAPSPYDPKGKKAMCCFPPVVRYQGELIEATFDSEPIGQDEIPDLLYLNFKAPDYAGHVYNMDDPRQAEVLAAVDQEVGALADLLTERFGDGRSVLIVTADHGQCPEIDANGGVRIDPIQLEEDLNAEFGTSVFGLVQMVAPSEVYLDPKALTDSGLSAEDVAAFLADYRYGDNIGPYIRPAAIQRDRLHERSFAAVLPASYIAELAHTDLARFGATAYDGRGSRRDARRHLVAHTPGDRVRRTAKRRSTAPAIHSPMGRRIAMPHRLSQSLQRILEIEEPLRRFFYESRPTPDRDPADPANCDFVAGNPQEMVLPEYVESLQRWTVPQDKDWYAYKFNEPYAQEAAAAGLRERRGVAFEADDVLVTDGAFAGLNLCIRTVTDPGDEVIFLTPPWFFYEAIILGGEAHPSASPSTTRRGTSTLTRSRPRSPSAPRRSS